MDIRTYYSEESTLHEVMTELLDELKAEEVGTERYNNLVVQLAGLQSIQREQASIVLEWERDNKAVPWWETVDWNGMAKLGVGATLLGLCILVEGNVRGVMVAPKWLRWLIPPIV